MQTVQNYGQAIMTSLPSRGAWIEILRPVPRMPAQLVAPLAGSVDRNLANWASSAGQALSLPSRGAWIEIS